jgi:hypothetical protein
VDYLKMLCDKIEQVNRIKQLHVELAKQAPSCCGGIPLDDEGKCPMCGEEL